MSRRRSTMTKFIFSIFALLSLYIGVLFGPRNYTRVFIALTTLAWHILANIYCAWISSYRFKNPNAKYIEIKNKIVRKIFVRPTSVDSVAFANKRDDETNILGFVLNIINTALFLSFEVLLFMPPIPCESYYFTFVIGTRPRNYEHLCFELRSFNEIIPAECSRAFAVITALIFLVFVVLFERQLKEHRDQIERNTTKTPPLKAFEKTEWYHPLHTSLVDISVRQNNKKHKFWYDKDQLEQIEKIVNYASQNAELTLETQGNKIVSFKVIDTLNNSVRFTGYFI